jgi:hypothetical protein
VSRGARGPVALAPTTPLIAILPAFLAFVAFASLARRRTLREKLARELRLIACAPIPSRGDKRFKRWDPDLVHPPGRWGDFVLRPGPVKPRRRHRRFKPAASA